MPKQFSKYTHLEKIQRKERMEGLKKAMYQIHEQGVSDEQMAVDLEVRVPTIWSWRTGKRLPKFATIDVIQRFYKVKIL